MRAPLVGSLARCAALGVLFVGAASPVLQAQQQRAVIRTRTVDTTGRDTVDISVSIDPGDIMRMVGDLMASRQLEERIAGALRESGAGRVDAEKLHELQSQLTTVARRNTGLMSAIRLQCARDHA